MPPIIPRLLFLAVLFVLGVPRVTSALPALLSYQGYLTNDQGVPLAGPANLEFALCDSITAGNVLWLESHPGVPLTDGIFHLALGSLTPIDPALFDGGRRWLETRVSGTPLTPRREFLAVPYAFRAAVADVALSGGSGDDWENAGNNVYRLNGNVGVGTAAPTERLHVVDPLFARLQLERTGGSTVKADASLTSASMGTTTSHPFRLITANAVRMTFDTAGNVGIGTINPTSTLQVNGSTARAIYGFQSGTAGTLTGVIGESNSISGVGVRGQANHATGLTYGVHGQATGSGGTGVFGEAGGSGSATGVRGTASNATGYGVYGANDASSGANYGVYGLSRSAAGFGIYGTNTAGGQAAYFDGKATTSLSHTIGTTSTLTLNGTTLLASNNLNLDTPQDMTTTAGGEALIETGANLDLDAGSTLTMTAGSQANLTSSGTMTLASSTGVVVTGPTLRLNGNVGLGQAPAFQLHLSSNSAAKPTSNTWTISSDRRLKKDIRPISSALDKLLRLNGVTYRWKDPGSQGGMAGTYMGLIAQDVEQVIPEWVATDTRGYRTLTVSGFEGLVAEAVRELQAEGDRKVADLEARCRMLEERLGRLEDAATDDATGAGVDQAAIGTPGGDR